MSTSGNVILVDAEHFGIRLLMPLLAVGGILGGFLLGSMIINLIDESITGACLGVPMAIVLPVLLVQLGERVIKPNWTSGRYIELTENSLIFVDQRRSRNKQYIFNLAQDINIDGWYFDIVERRHRVPKGWYCTAARLSQDEAEIIIYTFINPEEVHEVKDFSQLFDQLLRTKKKLAQASHHISDARVAARQKYLRTLEDERWEDGAEVTPDDFKLIMQYARS